MLAVTSENESYCERHTKGNVANIASAGLDARLSLKFKRRVIAEEHLRCVLDCSAACVDEFLQEHLAVHAVRLFPEDCAEDDCHTIVRRLDVDSLLVAVVDGSHAAALAHTLWRRLRGVLASFLVKRGIFVKGLLEGCSHGVALEQADASHQVILLLLALGEVLEVDLDTEVVALLGSNDVWAVFTLQDLLGAVLDQFAVAFYAGGDEDACLGLGCADVEGDIVEVGDNLVNGGRGSAVEEYWSVVWDYWVVVVTVKPTPARSGP